MDADSYRERLYDTFADADRTTEEKIDRALEIGTAYFGLPLGFLTRIEDGVQEIVQATGDHELIQPGETCPLDDAYCRRTVEVDGTLAVQRATPGSPISERAIETFGLGTYIGATVVVDDEVFGTVCFAAEPERETPFSEAEEISLELLAKLVGGALERRAYERTLRTQNERLAREKRRFEGIAETSFDILFRIDRDGTFTYVSSAVERILDYAPADLTGEPFAAFMTDASAEDALAAYSRVLEGHPVENLELDFLDRAGDVVVLEVNAVPIEDDDIAGIQGVGRDVTARKERQRELRLKNRAIDEAQLGFSIADNRRPDEPLVYVNEGFERLTGYDAADVLGENCRFLQGEATDPAAVEALRAAIDADESVAVELVNYRADGTPFWNRVQLSPVVDGTGTVTHYLGFQRDITERKRTEQLIRLLNRVLRHNLRNDMTALLGWAGLEQEAAEYDTGERIRRIAEDLVTMSERARELERFARSDRDPGRLDPEWLLGNVAEAKREAYPGATVAVQVRTDRGICAGPELEQAVAELVENAIVHDASEEPRVEIAVGDDGAWIELTVADDGPGIDEMEADVIASGNETALQHSSGLGLWLVNWIVTRYGGSFQIDGIDGEGSVATVRLPAIAADDAVEDVERGPTVLFR
jgi:PAS domain S-box-containing protein